MVAVAPKGLEIVFLGEGFVVINKPSGLLSVPGRSCEDSVAKRLLWLIPGAHGPLVAHRLDQATSGLMVAGLTPDDHRALSIAFAERRVGKFYEAVVSDEIAQAHGRIDLPLRTDINARPRQIVDHYHGRSAVTEWWRVEPRRLRLAPREGRTHQLRVHLAEGLNAPILGDQLYGGASSERLHLHATMLSFPSPRTRIRMHFEVSSPF